MPRTLIALAGLSIVACCLGASAGADTILFVGNSFTYAALSPVQRFRPETVEDLNHEGIGGVPALFKAFADQSGLDYRVSLETAPGTNLDFHFEKKAALIARDWDNVILQPYSTLDESLPGDGAKVIEYSQRLARLFESKNPRVDVRLVATWSRPDQTYLPSGHWFGKPIEAMAEDLRAACDRAVEHYPAIRAVIPVGQAWNLAVNAAVAVRNPYRGAPRGQIDLWAPDHYHGSTYGYYLEALTIFGSVTSRDPRALGGREQAAKQLGITLAEAVALQNVAWQSLQKEAGADSRVP